MYFIRFLFSIRVNISITRFSSIFIWLLRIRYLLFNNLKADRGIIVFNNLLGLVLRLRDLLCLLLLSFILFLSQCIVRWDYIIWEQDDHTFEIRASNFNNIRLLIWLFDFFILLRMRFRRSLHRSLWPWKVEVIERWCNILKNCAIYEWVISMSLQCLFDFFNVLFKVHDCWLELNVFSKTSRVARIFNLLDKDIESTKWPDTINE